MLTPMCTDALAASKLVSLFLFKQKVSNQTTGNTQGASDIGAGRGIASYSGNLASAAYGPCKSVLQEWISELTAAHMSHNQHLVLKWSTQNHVQNSEGGRSYGWDCPLLTFIYPGFDCGSYRCESAPIAGFFVALFEHCGQNKLGLSSIC